MVAHIIEEVPLNSPFLAAAIEKPVHGWVPVATAVIAVSASAALTMHAANNDSLMATI